MDLEISTFDLPSALERDGARARARPAPRDRSHARGRQGPRGVPGRRAQVQADRAEPPLQRGQVPPDGGRVSVAAKKDTTRVEIAVKDTGIGIAPEDHAVFEVQAGLARLHQEGGHGARPRAHQALRRAARRRHPPRRAPSARDPLSPSRSHSRLHPSNEHSPDHRRQRKEHEAAGTCSRRRATRRWRR